MTTSYLWKTKKRAPAFEDTRDGERGSRVSQLVAQHEEDGCAVAEAGKKDAKRACGAATVTC